MTTKPVSTGSGCAICRLGTEYERVLIAIGRNPKATKTHIMKSMHITRSMPRQKEIFGSISFRFVSGSWVPLQ